MAECNQPGCEQTVHARGACHHHYNQGHRGLILDVPLTDDHAYRTLDEIRRDPTFAKFNPDGWPWERTGQTPKEWSDEWYVKHPLIKPPGTDGHV